MTWADLVRDALLETGVQDPIEPVDPNFQSLALLRLNAILDQLNSDRQATYNVVFPTFTLTPNLSPHTIGPSAATFTVSQRPVEILGANLLLSPGTTSEVRIPIDVVDDAWWLSQPVPNIKASIPTAVYYSPDMPNGSLYFWPVPNTAYGLELEVRFVLAAIAQSDLGTTITVLPPGYQRALTLTLAEDLVTPFTVPMPQDLPGKAAKARAIIFQTNNQPVRIATRDAGMPGGRGVTRGGFNWMTGTGGGR